VNSRTLLIVLALGLGAGPLAAQQVIKQPVFDSVQASIRKTLYELRDSLQAVNAATARLVRDGRQASDALRRARAASIAERCGAAGKMAVVARAVVVKAGRPSPDKSGLLPRMERSLTDLSEQMDHCALEFTALTAAEKAPELRDYGVGRGARVEAAIRRYEPSVQLYFDTAIGDRYFPNLSGAGATPTGSAPASQ
jgi:hypothetical protein